MRQASKRANSSVERIFGGSPYLSNGQSALLQAVKNSIGNTYANSYIGADGQIVALNFDDGIRFEILPVFVNSSNTFTFADSMAAEAGEPATRALK